MRLLLPGVCMLAGCIVDPFIHYERPVRAEFGMNTRHFRSDPTVPTTARVTSSPTPKDIDGSAASVALRFMMRMRWTTYMGAEAEAGTFLGREGSNLAGAYAVFGATAPFRPGTIAAEIAGGWRGMRDRVGVPDHDVTIIEPRVRGELWLGDQFTLGATAGAELTSQHSWMAGIYLGVHSHTRDLPTPNR
ncbi:MAG TPA: hypothetical protein VL326_20255 [Kofleriaceae bacterium]|nr:hypothetical protein [Kofleriaceae bacterium]